MGREMKMDRLEDSVVKRIAERLSTLGDIYLPHDIRSRQDTIAPSEIEALLNDLLSRDAAIFLERYGSKLKVEELQEFEVLKDDYEISWHLKHIKSFLVPTKEESRLHAVATKNRRLAYMNRLIDDGQYFSEDAMRSRAPFLHHEYVGKYQDPTIRGFSRPGERWSETLMRQSEEAMIVAKIKEEQERLGIKEEEQEEEQVVEEEDGEEEEEQEVEKEEEDSKSDENMMDTNTNANDGGVAGTDQEKRPASEQLPSDTKRLKQILSDEELWEKMNHFTRLMQEKFLSGEDTEHVDYANIDNNVTLDDHWLREITQDAEEKYFEEDD
ncbi:hypothetical protein KI387_003117 [Taxus chinensis]|uniref:CCD97-like C-terminal domain-containing protein n=1 Tax=Taxus chinensis TaxID=29808 RepID=A0AA38LPB8_TAXCH|nr:hypothetical protein KI387_003117 [Taxus chinensis]